MSRFSGKADFYVHLWGSLETEEEAFERFNGKSLYLIQPLPKDFDWRKAAEERVNIPETYYKKVEYKSFKDLIPYYPHIVAFAGGSTVCLSPKSYVDEDEQETLEFYLKRILRIYNRCKRKKIEFNIEDAVKEVCWSDWNKEAIEELAKRVKLKGKKANIDGIHLVMKEYYRNELVKEMLKYGINPADYGYERFVRGETNESIER